MTLLMLSCDGPTAGHETRTEGAEGVMDTVLAKIGAAPTYTERPGEGLSPLQQGLNAALADSAIDAYYKEVYRQGRIIPADDNKMLSITEKLFTEDATQNLFYFLVFTRSMNASDGFYSEALSEVSFRYVTTRTEQFVDYFNIAPGLGEQDMDNWARYVAGEIRITREGHEKKAFRELEVQLVQNLEGKRKEYGAVREKFMERLALQLGDQ
jgi:hypothetical protein